MNKYIFSTYRMVQLLQLKKFDFDKKIDSSIMLNFVISDEVNK